MFSTTSAVVSCTVASLVYLLARRASGQKERLPYPPGPPPKFLLDNALDFPQRDLHITFREWGRKHNSGIVHASAVGMHFVAVNDRDIAEDLFEHRAKIYNDRADSAVAKMLGWTAYNLVMFPYGEIWREHRKLCWQNFNPELSKKYHPLQMEQVSRFINNIMNNPERVFDHISMLSISITMKMMFGYEPTSLDDPVIRLAESNIQLGLPLFQIGQCWINLFPFLSHIPHWVPGAKAQKIAKRCRDIVDELMRIPMAYVQKAMLEGRATPSLVTDFLEKKATIGASAEEEAVVNNVAWTVYTAASDTTTTATGHLLYLLAKHPEVQKRAQEELDKVIGPGRLPELNDRPSLPFIEAIYRELLRHTPPLPGSIPHSMVDDDVYEGYFLPKGTVVWPNIWAMTRDETKYPDPEAFKPERFFDHEGRLNDDSRVLAYGFGRRICVGKEVASSTMWLVIAYFLACFNIGPAKDEQGNEIPIDGTIIDVGGLTHKKPFKNSITPRNDLIRGLIDLALSNDS